jgi:transposase-like protein
MPGRRFRIYSREFKEAAVRRILAGERFAAVAKDLRLRSQLLYAWRDLYEHGGGGRAGPAGPAAEGRGVGPAPRVAAAAEYASAAVRPRGR